MAMAQIGVSPALAFECAHPIEAAIPNNGSAFPAAQARNYQAIATPIGLWIPEAAKVEAEPVIPMVTSLMSVGIEPPLRLGVEFDTRIIAAGLSAYRTSGADCHKRYGRGNGDIFYEAVHSDFPFVTAEQ